MFTRQYVLATAGLHHTVVCKMLTNNNNYDYNLDNQHYTKTRLDAT